VTFTVIHLLEAFSDAKFRTFMQQLTTFQLPYSVAWCLCDISLVQELIRRWDRERELVSKSDKIGETCCCLLTSVSSSSSSSSYT